MDKVEHLKIIQSVITRMASNSFLIKGWCVTLVSAILALAAKEPNKVFIAVAFFPVIMFWTLDGYFLHQERLFRELYKSVVDPQTSVDNFSMDVSTFKKGETTWRRSVFSETLNLFYITMWYACQSFFWSHCICPHRLQAQSNDANCFKINHQLTPQRRIMDIEI